ncbi:hypothetical protein GcM3_003027 [Golovinomyces cichoracearum]|uniref:Uncharacterized protein n=1 Tax=Golovinomyces cichoracearum TaxID=62708 RepID=A0A420JB88_9PEZI|nr:hypothetical protein GcM3_003027 [Golovinomyces cichoracearum]
MADWMRIFTAHQIRWMIWLRIKEFSKKKVSIAKIFIPWGNPKIRTKYPCGSSGVDF